MVRGRGAGQRREWVDVPQPEAGHVVLAGAGLGRRDLVRRRSTTTIITTTTTAAANSNPNSSTGGGSGTTDSGSNRTGRGLLGPQQGDEIIELLLELCRPSGISSTIAVNATTATTTTAADAT